MSQHDSSEKTEPLNPNIVAIVLLSIFGLITGLIFSQMPPPQPLDESRIVVVASTSTSIPLAAATTLPPTPTNTPVPTVAPTVTRIPDAITEEAVVSAAHDPALVARGESQFMLCTACHGADARGIPNLGKDLVESEFVAGQTDEELVQFITTGRPIWDPLNTTGVDMPPRGGNPAMTTEDIQAVVAYIRSLSANNSPTNEPAATSIPEDTVEPAGSVETVSAAYDPALVARGESQFMLCTACHGADARGIPNLGKDLVESEFVAGQTDEELVQFITTGRPIWDPLNTTGVDMPPRGGNPAMTTEDIQAVVAYIRSLTTNGD